MATDAPLSTKTVTPTEIRLAVEWLAANAHGVSLQDWEPRSQTLLNAANEIERLQKIEAIARKIDEGIATSAAYIRLSELLA